MFSRFHEGLVKNDVSIGSVVVKNSLYNLLSKFISTLVGIGLTPFIVSYLGLELYGVWCIMFVVLGYIALLDLGIGTSFMKFIAEFKALRDMEQINRVINSGLVFYSILGVITIGVISLLSERFTSFLSVPMSQKHNVAISFIGCGIVFAMSCVFSVFNLAIGGLQRMDVSSKIEIVRALLWMICTITFLKMGYGLKGLVGSYALANSITGLLAIWNTRILFPDLKIRPRFFNLKLFRELVFFGVKNQIASFSDLMTFQISKVLAGKFLGLSLAGAYEVGTKIPRSLREFAIYLVQPLLPASSELWTQGDRSKLKYLYSLATKLLIAMVLPIVIFISFTSNMLIYCWLGMVQREVAMILQVLSVVYFLNLACAVGSVVSIGIGKPEFQMRYGIIAGILNPVLSFLLLNKYHLPGLLWGTGITLIIANGYFMVVVNKYLKVSLFPFLRDVGLLPLIISLGLGFSIQSINKFLLYKGLHISRLGQVGFLLVEITLFVCITVGIILRSHYFNDKEKQTIKRYIPIFQSLQSN